MVHRTPEDEEALRQRVGDAEVVREVFETMPSALCALSGREQTFVAMNAAYRALVGRSDIVGRRVADVVPEAEGQQLYELLDRVFATGQPQVGEEWRLQLVRDDSGVPQDLYVNFTAVPRRAADGVVAGLNVQLVEVTDQVVARQAALTQAAEAQRRYEQAREVITALQRELLPTGVPVLPGAQIAASYLLADVESAAGGDWFDALSLSGGRVALVVGDVVGHGVAASAAMGQLRVLLQDRLEDDGDVETALAAVDRMATRIPGARAATVCVAVLDPANGALSYCTAGHPPPLMLSAAGEARYLPATGSGPLGTSSAFVVTTNQIGPGDVVLLYTDGIIERPGREIAASTVELAQVAADASADRALRTAETSAVERVCTQTLELLVRPTGHADDITLIAAQLVASPADLDLELPADVAVLAEVRTAFGAWLDELGAAALDASCLQHAIGEVVTNSVEHAYLAERRAGSVTLHATLTPGGEVHAEVIDDGRWREPPTAAGRGRGLSMSSELVNVVRVIPGEHGTTVTVRHLLSRPARLLTDQDIVSGVVPPSRHANSAPLMILDQSQAGGARLGLTGPVDAGTAQQLQGELARATRAGNRSLTVDLTGATHLASAGVAVLHQAVLRSAEQQKDLRLYAPPGSTAQHILTLVALPHLTRDPTPPER